jgi:hypothetical protein
MSAQLVTYGSLILGFIGVFLWARGEDLREYLPPSEKFPTEVYRLLERARDQLFRGSRDVRFTIFAQDEQQPELLRPIARLGWGRPSALSRIRFGKGEGLAGQAWDRPNGLLVAQFEQRDISDIEKARGVQREMLHLRPETAQALSEDQLRARTMIAIPIKDSSELTKGVLCVDYRGPIIARATSNEDIANEIGEKPDFCIGLISLATELAALLPPRFSPEIQPENLAQRDGASLKRIRLGERLEPGFIAQQVF